MDFLKQQKYLMEQIRKHSDKINTLMELLDLVSQIIEQEENTDDDTSDDYTTDSDTSFSDGDIRLLSDDE